MGKAGMVTFSRTNYFSSDWMSTLIVSLVGFMNDVKMEGLDKYTEWQDQDPLKS